MIDDTKRHGQAMKLLEEAGIYVFTAVATRFSSINRIEPYKSYHQPAMTEYFQTVNVMAQYPNTLGLLAGNGVVNSPSTQRAAPVIKAVVRDLKRYMKIHNEANGQRILPIGYTAATVDQLDTTVLDFLSLGDSASSIDFWTVKGEEQTYPSAR
jgi:1,3-beta-glucanosyltransferase GAS5